LSRGGAVYYLTYDHGMGDYRMSPIAHSVRRMTLRRIALLGALALFSLAFARMPRVAARGGMATGDRGVARRALALFSLIGFFSCSETKLTGPPAWSILIMSLGMPDPAPPRENCFFYQGRSVYSGSTCSRETHHRNASFVDTEAPLPYSIRDKCGSFALPYIL